LKTDLDALVVTGKDGTGLAESVRASDSEGRTFTTGARWSRIAGGTLSGEKRAMIATIHGRPMMAIAAPVCSARARCAPDGAVIVGLRLDTVLNGARGQDAPRVQGIAVFASSGATLASSGIRAI